ncbi:MAG: glycosyltransferase family 2 protein [Oligoflexia bacterium]|nr:glycosyltransferase family 2 protein [Oligoflexia bacterium]
MKRSVLLAVYNEGPTVGPMIRGLKEALGEDCELVVVDDGSQDDTVANIPQDLCRLIRHEFNKGKGAAIRTGVQQCRGDVIGFIDGDGQDDPKDLIEVFKQVENGKDFVIGSRFINSDDRYNDEAVQPINEFGNKSLTKIINLLFDGKLTDTQASIKAIRKELISDYDLISDKYEIETEIVIKSLCRGLEISEVPVYRFKREHGISNLFDIPLGRFRFALRALRIIALGFLYWKPV